MLLPCFFGRLHLDRRSYLNLLAIAVKAGCKLVSTANQYVLKYVNVIRHSCWTLFALGKGESRLPELRVWGSLQKLWDVGCWIAVGQALPSVHQSYSILVNKLWRTGLVNLHKWSLAPLLGQGSILRSWEISVHLFPPQEAKKWLNWKVSEKKLLSSCMTDCTVVLSRGRRY